MPLQVIIGNPELKANHNITQIVEVMGEHEKYPRMIALLKQVCAWAPVHVQVVARLAGWGPLFEPRVLVACSESDTGLFPACSYGQGVCKVHVCTHWSALFETRLRVHHLLQVLPPSHRCAFNGHSHLSTRSSSNWPDLLPSMHVCFLLCQVASTSGPGSKVLIFCETKRGCDDITRSLRADGWPALALHGDKQQRERDW